VPTYEYECEKEGKRFEAFQKMTDAPLKRCPDCGGRVRRLISSGAGVIFKGSGFYSTDYGRGPSRAEHRCPSAGCCQRDEGTGKLPCES
jgi:putative FmdB family regulatory protein